MVTKSPARPAPRKKAAAPAQPAVSLAERAHRELMNMILGGQLAPNELVTERQIALQLGISRTPLREAIRRLEGARLLERQRSGALVVRALPVEEYMHILHVRKLLEGEAARLAAGRVPPEQVAQARARIEEVLALPEDKPLPEGPSTAEDLHRIIAEAAGNPVLEEMIAALRTRTAMFRFGRLPSRRRKVMQEHLEILDAIGQGDGDKARQAMEAHIGEVRSTILAKLSGH